MATIETPKTSLQLVREIMAEDMTPCLEDINFWLPSGCDILNWAMCGVEGKGYPGGQFIEIHGGESSGKTALALIAAREMQLQGGEVWWIDVEKGLKRRWARTLGVDVDSMIYCDPRGQGMALRLIEEGIAHRWKENNPTLFILDSVAGCLTEKSGEDYKSLDNPKDSPIVGGEAAEFTWFFKRDSIRKMRRCGKIIMIWINQIRSDIGAFRSFGPPPTSTPGGRALKYWADIRIKLGKSKSIVPNQSEKKLGIFISSTIIKNKLGTPLQEANFPLWFTHGIDNALALIYYLKAQKAKDESLGAVFTSNKNAEAGPYVTWGGKKVTNGKLRDMMLKDKKLYQDIREFAMTTFVNATD